MKVSVLSALKGAALGALLVLATPAAAEPVYLTTPEGDERLLASEPLNDYIALATYLEYEHIQTFCAPATMAGVLNSLDVERPQPLRIYPFELFTQDSIFTEENQAVKAYAKVEHEGMTLEEIGTFLTNLGVEAEVHYADKLDTDALRQIAQDTLADPDARLMVNYTREVIGQIGAGHVSPIGAYHEDSESLLVLDVAKYKYPPSWLTLDEMLAAMQAVDSGSGLSRGLVVVRRP